MGDILHTHERLHTTAFNTVTDIFKRISAIVKTFVLVGNHDYINNSQFLTTNHWMNCFKTYPNLVIVDQILVEYVNDMKIVLCPYVPDGRFKEALDTKDEEWIDASYIFAHQLLDGAKMGAIVAENVEKWRDEYPILISGHIHDKQQVQPNLIYTGSCMQHAFGESSDKTLLLIEDNDIQYIDLNLSKKKIIYMEADSIDTFRFSELDEKNEYKIVVNGDNDEFNSFRKTSLYRDILKRGIKVVFKQKRVEIVKKNEVIKTNIRENNGQTFKEILNSLITNEDNSFLNELMHEIVFNQKCTKQDNEILFVDE